MAGPKVKLKDQLGRVVRLGGDSAGATVGKDLRWPDGSLVKSAEIRNPSTDTSGTSPAATVWKLIREVPANLQKLAKLAGVGFVTRDADGEWHQRSITAGEGVQVNDGDGVAGDPVVGLAELPDAGGGTLQKTARDSYGRLAGTSAADTSDLPEGSNLYFTNARADARAAAAVAAHEAKPDPHPQYAKLAGDRFTGPMQFGLSGLINTGALQIPLVQTAGPDATHVVSVRYSANAAGAVSFVGKSRSTQIGVAGAVIDNDVVGEFRFVSDDGTAVMIRGAALVARIQGAVAAGVTPTRLEFSTMNAAGVFAARWRVEASGELVPHIDSTYEIGTSANRPKQLWAATGTINTSDAREKTPVRPLSQAELAAAAELANKIGSYQWLAMLEAKGQGARQHIGMTVQGAIAVLESHGLDPFAYGFICYDQWDELPEIRHEWPALTQVEDDFGNIVQEARDAGFEIEQEYRPAGDRYSFRMDELLAFIAAGQRARISAIEQQLAALTG